MCNILFFPLLAGAFPFFLFYYSDCLETIDFFDYFDCLESLEHAEPGLYLSFLVLIFHFFFIYSISFYFLSHFYRSSSYLRSC